MDDSNASLTKMNSAALVRQNFWRPVEKAKASFRFRANKESSPVIKWTQFPLMLSWAYTIHKVQVSSLDKAVISIDKQRAFNYS